MTELRKSMCASPGQPGSSDAQELGEDRPPTITFGFFEQKSKESRIDFRLCMVTANTPLFVQPSLDKLSSHYSKSKTQIIIDRNAYVYF